MTQSLARVRPGDAVTAASFNALVDAVQQSLRFSAAYPLVVERTSGGVLLRLARQPLLKFVALAGDVEPGAVDGAGNVLDYDASENAWADSTATAGLSPQTVAAFADPWESGAFLAGERRVVYFDHESGKYLPLAAPGPHLAVAATTIDRGASGTVVLQRIDGEGDEAATEIEIEAHNSLLPRVWEDSPCWIEAHPQSRRWFLTRAYSATRLLAHVNESGGVSEADATFDVDGVVPLDGAFPETTISGVNNTFHYRFDDDALVALVWNDANLCWETWQGECPAET